MNSTNRERREAALRRGARDLHDTLDFTINKRAKNETTKENYCKIDRCRRRARGDEKESIRMFKKSYEGESVEGK